ncbi:hypothetical protein CLOSTASPAR_03568 [[Clostridium] asparagiforme DSM 15981]|uniref:Uncharacterized protein n=1 Tax=[Clostridium] asparagiforme DSM 15981 TaxID=518636 RepID=C0D2S9_9FIRM|nr:hypothetical protein CLOSTASPAR_03568 [[Clostridium] asparagiforme DSM 15981]
MYEHENDPEVEKFLDKARGACRSAAGIKRKKEGNKGLWRIRNIF